MRMIRNMLWKNLHQIIFILSLFNPWPILEFTRLERAELSAGGILASWRSGQYIFRLSKVRTQILCSTDGALHYSTRAATITSIKTFSFGPNLNDPNNIRPPKKLLFVENWNGKL